MDTLRHTVFSDSVKQKTRGMLIYLTKPLVVQSVFQSVLFCFIYLNDFPILNNECDIPIFHVRKQLFQCIQMRTVQNLLLACFFHSHTPPSDSMLSMTTVFLLYRTPLPINLLFLQRPVHAACLIASKVKRHIRESKFPKILIDLSGRIPLQ